MWQNSQALSSEGGECSIADRTKPTHVYSGESRRGSSLLRLVEAGEVHEFLNGYANVGLNLG